jgi:hypothetical protein
MPTEEESEAMNAAYGLITFGVVFFGFMVVLGVVRARHSKERAYYLSGLVAGLMFFAMASILLSQFILSAAFFFTAFIVSVAAMLRVKNAFENEAVTQRQETNVSEVIKARDLLSWKVWFKLTYRIGAVKAMLVYIFVMTGISGGILFAFTAVGFLNPTFAAIYTVVAAAVSIIIFRHQVERNLKQ